MKDLKKFINKTSDIVYKFLEKIATFIKDDKHSLVIKAVIKLIILLLIFNIAGLVAQGFIQGGTYIIHNISSTARNLLSSIWATVVNFTYFLFVIVSIYRLADIAEKDGSFFILFKNKKKDKEVKKKIFEGISSFIKIVGTIFLIPVFTIDISLLFVLGIMIGYLKEGIYLYSLFGGVIGLIIFFTVLIFIVKELLTPGDSKLKKYMYITIISGIIVATSSITILFETSKYEINRNLTSDFNTSTLKYEYKINNKKDYVINHHGDKNLELVIDDDLGSYLEIRVNHTTTNVVNTKINEEDDKVSIIYYEDLDIKTKDLEKIFNLGIRCIKDKTIYNYTLLKYATIEVRVSSDYAENIKFINDKGKEYTPYERINKQ